MPISPARIAVFLDGNLRVRRIEGLQFAQGRAARRPFLPSAGFADLVYQLRYLFLARFSSVTGPCLSCDNKSLLPLEFRQAHPEVVQIAPGFRSFASFCIVGRIKRIAFPLRCDPALSLAQLFSTILLISPDVIVCISLAILVSSRCVTLIPT